MGGSMGDSNTHSGSPKIFTCPKGMLNHHPCLVWSFVWTSCPPTAPLPVPHLPCLAASLHPIYHMAPLLFWSLTSPASQPACIPSPSTMTFPIWSLTFPAFQPACVVALPAK